MVTRRVPQDKPAQHRRHKATTPEGREDQLVGLAVDLAERQLREGTASAQVLSHYLKLASSRERLEQERLAQEIELTKIKRDAIASQKRVEELYTKALDAMRTYSGAPPDDPDPDHDRHRAYDD